MIYVEEFIISLIKQNLNLNLSNYKEGSYIYVECGYRKKAFNYYEHKCYYCDYSNVAALQVHHLDKNRDNNNIENLRIVCPTHHIELHYNLLEI